MKCSHCNGNPKYGDLCCSHCRGKEDIDWLENIFGVSRYFLPEKIWIKQFSKFPEDFFTNVTIRLKYYLKEICALHIRIFEFELLTKYLTLFKEFKDSIITSLEVPDVKKDLISYQINFLEKQKIIEIRLCLCDQTKLRYEVTLTS